jgi:hypothetical protein
MQAGWKPAAPRRVLHALSGLVWSGVSLLLLRWVWVWLSPMPCPEWLPSALGGVGLALATWAGFSWMAKRNIARIERGPERPCVFTFQRWSSYPVVAFMVALGLTWRHSSLPRTWLAPLYLGIGGGLFLASVRYYRHILTGTYQGGQCVETREAARLLPSKPGEAR